MHSASSSRCLDGALHRAAGAEERAAGPAPRRGHRRLPARGAQRPGRDERALLVPVPAGVRLPRDGPGDDRRHVRGAYWSWHARGASCGSSLARLQRIFDSVEEVYVETTLDGRILEVSPSASRWIGKDVDPRGLPAWDFYARPEDRERLMAALRRDGRVRDFESVARLPDGRTVACASNLALVTDEETGESRIVGSLRDITEQKRAEAERRTARAADAAGPEAREPRPARRAGSPTTSTTC